MRLVIFDLDGTITYRDTLLPYVTGYLARSGRSRLRGRVRHRTFIWRKFTAN